MLETFALPVFSQISYRLRKQILHSYYMNHNTIKNFVKFVSIECLWYNSIYLYEVINAGLNFKLDVGLYRLDQQVACQRIDNQQ